MIDRHTLETEIEFALALDNIQALKEQNALKEVGYQLVAGNWAIRATSPNAIASELNVSLHNKWSMTSEYIVGPCCITRSDNSDDISNMTRGVGVWSRPVACG